MVIDSDIVDVSIGGSFGVAQDRSGILWSWGKNSSGQLGLADLEDRTYPNALVYLKNKNIKQVVCGGQFAIAIGPTKQIKASKPTVNDENRPTNKNADIERIVINNSAKKLEPVEKRIEPVELDSNKKIFNINTITFNNSEMQLQKSQEK